MQGHARALPLPLHHQPLRLRLCLQVRTWIYTYIHAHAMSVAVASFIIRPMVHIRTTTTQQQYNHATQHPIPVLPHRHRWHPLRRCVFDPIPCGCSYIQPRNQSPDHPNTKHSHTQHKKSTPPPPKKNNTHNNRDAFDLRLLRAARHRAHHREPLRLPLRCVPLSPFVLAFTK